MTFGLDVRWRKQSLRALGLPAGLHRPRPGLRHRRLPQAPGRRRLPRLRDGPVLGHAGRQPHRAPAGPGQRRRAAGGRRPRSTGSPAATPCATSPTSPASSHEFGRIVRPGGRISLLEVSEPDAGLLRTGRPDLVPPRGAAHRRPAVGPGRLPVPAPVDRLPAGHRRAARPCSTEAGFSAVNRRALSGGLSQLITATRVGPPVTPAPAPADVRRPGGARAVGRAAGRGPARAARRAADRPLRPGRRRRHRPGRRRPGAGRPRHAPSRLDLPGGLDDPAASTAAAAAWPRVACDDRLGPTRSPAARRCWPSARCPSTGGTGRRPGRPRRPVLP